MGGVGDAGPAIREPAAFKLAVSQGTPEELLRAEIDGKLRLYQAWAGSLPHGECRVLEGAGHASIHWSHPNAVIQAIQDLLGQADR